MPLKDWADRSGKDNRVQQAALEQYFATEEAQRRTRISLIAEIATAWLTIAPDEDQLARSRQTLKTFEETLCVTTGQFRIGVASEFESRQAERNYQATRRTRSAQDRNALDLSVGAPVEPALLPTDLSSTVLLRRPDLLETEHQLIAARANAAQVAARLYDARYRAGVDRFLTSLDAQRTAYTAQQQLVTARFDRGGNLVELYRALRGGLN